MSTTYKILDVVGNVFTIKYYSLSGRTAILEAPKRADQDLDAFISMLNPFVTEADTGIDHSDKIGQEGQVPPKPEDPLSPERK